MRGWTGRQVCEHQVTAVGQGCQAEVRGVPKSGRRNAAAVGFRPQYYPDFGTKHKNTPLALVGVGLSRVPLLAEWDIDSGVLGQK